MAANDYYNGALSPRPHYSPYDPSPSHQGPAPSYPPSYGSQTPQPNHDDRRPSAVSPFDSVFDDHVYPANSRHPNDTLNNSQQSFAQDTRYHSPAPGNVSPVGDDIPLQSNQKVGNTGIPAMDGNDHVYDAANGAGAGARNRGMGNAAQGRLRFGELGMMGANKRRIPLVVYFFSIVQIAVFVSELVKASQLTGSPIQTQPSFNPMIGPSQNVLISMGSRFVPCMHYIANLSKIESWQCPNSTSNNVDTYVCSLSDVCAFGGVPSPITETDFPNQWWRFITPIFMHAGFVHIGFNLLLQLTMGKEIEMAIGSIRFLLVYMSAGIFGFVMGGNFAATGVSSTGASGALFGVIALTLLDLLYSWKERRNPVRELMFIIIEVLVSFVLGLLPGLDNFSHIGGFLMGLCLGICVLHSPNALREKIGEDHFANTSYSSVGGGITSVAFPPFLRNPVGFFKGRRPLWWAWWLVRAAFLITVIVVFIVLLNNFYKNENVCSWCKYLSCLPVNGWCDVGNVSVQDKTKKRGVEALLRIGAHML